MHKVEVLKERDEDLIKAVAHSSELEAALKFREDQLELSKGVVAENFNLQAKAAYLTVELGIKMVEVYELKGGLSVNTDILAHAKKQRATAIFEAAVLKDALHICRFKWAKEMEASTLKIVGLEGRIQGLETELSALNEQVALFKREDVPL